METQVKEQAGVKGQGHATQHNPGQDINVPLSAITGYFKSHANRAVTNTQKKYLWEIVEGLGPAIVNHTNGVTSQEFIVACGVNPEWANLP
jgi:hypothetical protein